ncbi:hypothetical protein [Microcystis aeruginosa]|uniref:hypothetical protein n=1 Tax=Microcystis aeruginosa TaxID=1126 RepID=UPI00232E8A46|nr:hypothetical protein [Microcystis aeruginosa]MDB9418566.1 hypothetical protein [Microcystis aeruginosa CS-556/03]
MTSSEEPKHPINLVVKTEQTYEEILEKVAEQAKIRYKIRAIVERYLESVEKVINIPELINRFERVLAEGKGGSVIAEMILQSRVEFNLESEP